MTTYNTGNPIGSTDSRDRLDNSENFDAALNALEPTWEDRLGVTRDTFEGALSKLSFYRVGTFAAGYTLTNMRQTLEYSGHEYSWAGTFPKVVAAGATPATSGGIGAGAWVDRTDDALRDEIRETVFQNMNRLAAEAGYNLVAGSFEEGGTLTNTNDVLWYQSNGRYYSWNGALPKVVAAGTDPTSVAGYVPRTDVVLRSQLAGPGGSGLIGTPSGYTQQEINDRAVDVLDYGAHPITEPGFETFDSTAAFLAAIATGRPVKWRGAYRFSAPLTQANGADFCLVGDDGVNYTAEGNASATDLSIGATLIWVGGATSAPIIHPTNDIGTGTIVASNFRVIVPPSVACPVQFDSTRYNNTIGAAGAVVRSKNVAVLCTGFNQNPGTQGNSVLRIKADATGDTGFGRFAFGWDISDWYAFNFEQGLLLESPNGFINGNHFDNWKMYQVYRPLVASAGTGANSIYQNSFCNLQVQPGRRNDGVNPVRFADGLLRYDKNFSGNVFTNLCLYDVDTTGVAIVHTNAPGGVSNNLYLGAGDTPGGTRNIHNGLPGWFIRQDGNHKVKSVTIVDYGDTQDGIKVLAKNNTYEITSKVEGAGTRIQIKMDGVEKFSIGPAGMLRIAYVPEFASNAAALSVGLKVGDVYRIGDTLAVVH